MNRRGFSVLEMSITIIIISVFTVMVVSGKSLRESVGISNVIAEWKWYQKTVKNFKDVYNYWPGDVPTTSIYGTYLASTPGDNFVSHTTESPNAFRQLALFTEDENKIKVSTSVTLTATIRATNMDSILPQIKGLSYLSQINPKRVNNFHWNLLTVPQQYYDGTYTFSSGYGSSQSAFTGISNISLMVSSLVYGDSDNGQYTYPPYISSAYLPSITASKIDGKGDDGLPFAGDIQAFTIAWGSTNYTNICTNPAAVTATSIVSGNITNSTQYLANGMTNISSLNRCGLVMILDQL